jgi:pimeloyl-ACP methyl ester carboxylesterase
MILPQDKWLTANGTKLHYLDWGNPLAQSMVLLHGFCSHARYWDFFARSLRTDYHVLALDMRGHGDSGCATSYTLQDAATDLAQFSALVELKGIVLIGISLGGLVSLLYAAEHADDVTKLVIVDIGPEFDAKGIEHIGRDLGAEPEFFVSEEEAFSYLKQTQPLSSDAFVRHQAKYGWKRDGGGNLRCKYDRAMCRLDLQSPIWLWDYLGKIKCPTLVVRAENSDMLSQGTAHKMVAKLPRGKLAEVPHAGHTVVGDNPEGFEKEVRRFLL